MSCDFYRRKQAYLQTNERRKPTKDEKKFMDDRELLAYLIAQERAAETPSAVAYDSYTSD